MMNPRDRLVVALDVDDLDRARVLVRTLLGRVGMFKVGLELFTLAGPSIVQELNLRCLLMDAHFAEVPILFHDRRGGRSKLNLRRLVQGMLMVWKLRRLHHQGTL